METPEWRDCDSSNVGAYRYWSKHPDYGRPVLEVYFHTSKMTYGYAVGPEMFGAMVRAGSKGKFVHRNLVPLGYLFKTSGRT